MSESEQDQAEAISRRSFFKKAGLAAGALATAPLLTPASEAQAGGKVRPPAINRSTLNLGVLLPSSRIVGALRQSFVEGLRLALEQNGALISGKRVQLFTQEYGVLPSAAGEQALRLVKQQRVSAIIAVLSRTMAGELRRLLAPHGVALIVASPGANVLRDGSADPGIVHASLDTWRSAWALGNWAARNVGRSAVVASSFYESGFDADYAFQLGFESGGGRLLDTLVAGAPSSGLALGDQIAAIRALQPSVVYASASGAQARSFVGAYAQSKLAGQSALLGSAFLTDEGNLDALKRQALGIKSALPWAHSLGSTANRSFVQAYQKQARQRATPFALLGYETGQLLAGALAGGASSGAQLQLALARASLTSPRGKMALQPGSLELNGPIYLAEVRKSGAGVENAIVAELAPPSALDQPLRDMRASLKTGWQTMYLAL